MPRTRSIPVFDSHFRELATVVKIPVLIFLVLALVVWLLLSRTVIGRHLYALGGNEEAARLSGIQTERVKWLAYCIGAVTAAIAGILYIGDNSSAEPHNMAVGYELNAIAAAVVGGCSLLGGVGTIPGVVLGVLFLQVVIDGVGKVIKTDSETYQGLVVGIVLVFAVGFQPIPRNRPAEQAAVRRGVGHLVDLHAGAVGRHARLAAGQPAGGNHGRSRHALRATGAQGARSPIAPRPDAGCHWLRQCKVTLGSPMHRTGRARGTRTTYKLS